MENTNAFRLINLGVGALMLLGGIGQFFHISVSSGILGVYVVLFGLVVAGLELTPNVPPQLSRYASFLFSFVGRGVFYVFVGSLIFEGRLFRELVGGLICLVGFGYVALEYVPSIEPPPTMREEVSWGAEQI